MFDFPEDLIALEPVRPSRIMGVAVASDPRPEELTWDGLIQTFQPGDVLVLNDTRVEQRRVFALTSKEAEFEILFVDQVGDSPSVTGAGSASPGTLWQVLCPVSRLKPREVLRLPGGIEAQIVESGRVQKLRTSHPLDSVYFEKYGEVPLPPYIQKARAERHHRAMDSKWYQTDWARVNGSSAAPTASLHFSARILELLRARGVLVETVTLHVGLGTYLPVTTDNLEGHQIHREHTEVSAKAWQTVTDARARGAQVWALGTTVVRSLESVAHGRLQKMPDGSFVGETDLYILPGFEFKVVSNLLTNFHQPGSTLLGLVAAFATKECVLSSYRWAIERRFRLFSYGDLTVWFGKFGKVGKNA